MRETGRWIPSSPVLPRGGGTEPPIYMEMTTHRRSAGLPGKPPPPTPPLAPPLLLHLHLQRKIHPLTYTHTDTPVTRHPSVTRRGGDSVLDVCLSALPECSCLSLCPWLVQGEAAAPLTPLFPSPLIPAQATLTAQLLMSGTTFRCLCVCTACIYACIYLVVYS